MPPVSKLLTTVVALKYPYIDAAAASFFWALTHVAYIIGYSSGTEQASSPWQNEDVKFIDVD
jgi:hypothetical protein